MATQEPDYASIVCLDGFISFYCGRCQKRHRIRDARENWSPSGWTLGECLTRIVPSKLPGKDDFRSIVRAACEGKLEGKWDQKI